VTPSLFHDFVTPGGGARRAVLGAVIPDFSSATC